MELPCFGNRFMHGKYAGSRYNVQGSRFAEPIDRRHRVEVQGVELQDVAALESSTIVRWEVPSVSVLIRLCCVGVCV